MERRRADTHQRRRQQNHRKAADIRQHDDPHQRAQGAQRQQVRHRLAIGVETHPGLQQRGGDLEGQGNHPHLGKTQPVVGLEHGIDRRQHRLDQVVDQVRQGTSGDDPHDQRAALGRRGAGGGNGRGTAYSHDKVFHPVVGIQLSRIR
ncbi:hypothetical protein D3C80_1502980 [compost metagenome]